MTVLSNGPICCIGVAAELVEDPGLDDFGRILLAVDRAMIGAWPMSRFAHWATRSASVPMAFMASLPTTTSSPSMSTTLGVRRSPSALTSVTGWPRSSSLAITEYVVPRSMPTAGGEGCMISLTPVFQCLAQPAAAERRRTNRPARAAVRWRPHRRCWPRGFPPPSPSSAPSNPPS